MYDKELEKRLIDLVDGIKLFTDGNTERPNIDETYEDCIIRILQKFPEFKEKIKSYLNLGKFY